MRTDAHGPDHGRVRRLTPLAGLLLFASGCGVLPSAEDQAVSMARDKARRMGNVLRGSTSLHSARDLAHRASELDDAEVMGVSGTSPESAGGVRVVVRVPGTGTESFGGDTITLKRCFELRVDGRAVFDTTPPQVACPATAPLRFEPWPKTPPLPSEARLRKAIPRVPIGGVADEAKVRRAVDALHLNPAISARYHTDGDKVGLSLTVHPSTEGAADCVLVRVAPGRNDVFVPSTIQRMPGEGGCDPGNAINPMPPPH